MQQVIDKILQNSSEYINTTDKKIRKVKGQFLTPYNIARFMASLFLISEKKISILDPGAGTGLLTLAIVEKLISVGPVKNIVVDLFENDIDLIPALNKNMQLLKDYCLKNNVELSYNIISENFIMYNRALWEEDSTASRYNIIIGNPPYQKLRNDCEEARTMNSIVYGQCNSYFLFLAMAIHLLDDSGELVFILPRSFFSGKYFSRFRQWMLSKVSVTYIHHFKSRYKIFQGEIIQEIVIVKLVKNLLNAEIAISSSEGSDDLDNSNSIIVDKQIVIEDSKELYIRIPLSDSDIMLIKLFNEWKYTLNDFGLKFCTGPIVDFRAKSYIRELPCDTTVPLIWSCNFNGTYVSWPKNSRKFPQYIESNEKIEKRLVPNKNYVLIKRVLAREGKKRVKVNLYIKQDGYQYVGIENHLNYLRYPDEISVNVLKGIYVLLNSPYYEKYIRIVNGTTQLNAFELNNFPFPDLTILEKLGATINQCDIEAFDLSLLDNL